MAITIQRYVYVKIAEITVAISATVYHSLPFGHKVNFLCTCKMHSFSSPKILSYYGIRFEVQDQWIGNNNRHSHSKWNLKFQKYRAVTVVYSRLKSCQVNINKVFYSWSRACSLARHQFQSPGMVPKSIVLCCF